MRMPKRQGLSVLCCALLALGAGCSDQTPPAPAPSSSVSPGSMFQHGVNIATKFDQPGFNYEDPKTQKKAGFETDLADFLDRELDFPDISLNPKSSDRREDVLQKGTYQLVIATYSITDDREKVVDFAGPYMENYQGLLVRTGDQRITSDTKTAAKKVICTALGSTSAPGSSKQKKKHSALLPGAEILALRDYSECVERLRNGSIDAVWTDLLILYGFMELYDDVRVVEDLKLGAPQRYGIGIGEGQDQDCHKIAEALRQFLSSGWHQSFSSHFPRLVSEDKQFEQHYKPHPADIEKYSCLPD